MKRTNLKEDFLQSMPDVARCQQGLDRNVATKEGFLSEGLFASTRQPCASSSTLANTMVPTLALSLQSCSGSSISNSNSSGLNKISPKTKIQMITTPGLAVGQSEFRQGSMVFRERQLHTSSSSSADKVMRMLGLAQNNCFGGSISNLNGSGSEMISPQAKIQMMPTPGVTIGQSEPLWGSRVFGKGKLHPSSSYSAKKMMGMQGLSQKNCCGDSISTLKGSDLTMIVPKSTIQMMPTPTLAAGQSEHRRGSQVMETTAVIQLRELHQRHTLVPENRHITEANSRFNLHQNSLGYSDRRGPIMISKGFYQYTGATIVSQGLMMRQKQPNVPGKCCSHNHVLLQASPIRPFKRKAVEDLEDIQPLSKCMKPIASISSWGMTHVKGHQHLFLVPSFDSKEIDETKKIEFGLHFGLEKDQIFRNDVMDNDTAEIEREEGIRLCFEDIQPLFKCMKPDASLSSLGNTHAKEHQHSDLVSSFGLKEIDEMKKIESNISFGLEKDQIVGNDVMDNETVEIEREDYINLCFEDIQHFSEFMEPDGSISSMEKSHAKGHQHVDLSPSLDLEEINREECINQTTGSTEIDKQTMMGEKLYTKDASAYKPRKSKIIGASLIEQFTSEQLIDHINSLKRWDGQNKAHVEKNRAIQGCANDDPCQLCMIERRTFYSPSIYCSKCSVRIKKKTFYYTISSNDLSHFICTCCHQRTRGDSVEVDGTFYLKSMLKKKRDNEETHELWVQCDKCDASQHQICALFNKRRNNEVYTCPKCLIKEMENGERPPQPPEVVLGAKDLPKTLMSNHIERRLFTRLKAEREERARIAGKNFDEVPGAEGLVVRVVSSVDKRAEVKRQFLKVFQQENYPSEFPYKSKVLLLFQKIEGVDVCLFVMFVQEYGTKSPLPNRQCVYLSYLDSIKYFQPEVKTTTGEALRTFVYHEILIGYLEYCKKRGFASCNIWASPPRKGEDYILYCHPEIQKTPKYDMLQEWYISMLRKAANEKIVVELTNLYDQFFTSIRECTAKVTPMHLPYFDGDYWPGAAEDMINQFQIEDSRKGKWKKLPGKKSVRTNCLKNPSSNFFKDVLLMKRLGEAIFPVKEDFIMVHLQHVCSHCSVSMVSGACWVCAQCDKFQLCDKCHDFELLREEREKHPSDSREKHLLSQVHMDYLPIEMEDEDEIFESKIFDTRTSFLNFCKANRYQYDTLRRAKYSSMMLLDYLHHPTSATSEETCDDDPGIKEVT